eukprot:jgi/Psemu1/51409/gm1.51409_g
MSPIYELDRNQSNDEENVLYSFPAFESVGKKSTGGELEERPPLVLELVPLPFLSDAFDLMPVGARGWYASAILSAMMMMSFSSRSYEHCSGEEKGEDENRTDENSESRTDENSESASEKGIDLLREDLKRALANGDLASIKAGGNSNNVFLELGSGTIGLAGMTIAWIVAQHRCRAKYNQGEILSNNKVMLTDYDQICLDQLERNAVTVRRTLGNYFSDLGGNEGIDHVHREVAPDIDVLRLDWNEYDQDQSPVLPENDSDCVLVRDDENHTISFACGAALVYTKDTDACADQVAKILRLHPQSVVWVVQWPRNGWFHVFQQQLKSPRHKRDGLNIHIQNFGPLSSPELFSNDIQNLAIQLMPEEMHQECRLNITQLRAIRITNSNCSEK